MISSRQTVQRATPARQRAPEPGRILALDYGRARIGLALADGQARLARPLSTLARKNRSEDLRQLRDLVREHGVTRIVLGLPLRLDGTRGEMAEEVERFAERLRKQLGLPVDLMDERLSSWEAEALLAVKEKKISHRDFENAKKSRKKNRKENSVDAVAAAVILREFLAQRDREKERD